MNNPTTVSQNAQMPRETVRKGGLMGATTRVYPRVRGGICDHCGIIDPNVDSQDQYRLCPHYRGMSLECNYCDPTKDQREVARISVLYIYDHALEKDSMGRPRLAVVCDSFNCVQKHRAELGLQ